MGQSNSMWLLLAYGSFAFLVEFPLSSLFTPNPRAPPALSTFLFLPGAFSNHWHLQGLLPTLKTTEL